MLSAQSTTEDYIRAEHKLQSVSKLFILQIIIPQDFGAYSCSAGTQNCLASWCFEPRQPQRITSGLKTNLLYLPVIHFTSNYTTSHVFLAYKYSSGTQLNTGTCIQQCDLFYSAGLHRNEKIGRGFGKNAGEWTGR